MPVTAPPGYLVEDAICLDHPDRRITTSDSVWESTHGETFFEYHFDGTAPLEGYSTPRRETTRSRLERAGFAADLTSGTNRREVCDDFSSAITGAFRCGSQTAKL